MHVCNLPYSCCHFIGILAQTIDGHFPALVVYIFNIVNAFSHLFKGLGVMGGHGISSNFASRDS